MKKVIIWMAILVLGILMISCTRISPFFGETKVTIPFSYDMSGLSKTLSDYNITISKITVEATNDLFTYGPIELSYDSEKETASGKIKDVVEGTYTVTLKAYYAKDGTDTLVAIGSQENVEVKANQSTNVNISMKLLIGKGSIFVNGSFEDNLSNDYIFAMQFSSPYFTGVSTLTLKSKGYSFEEENDVIKWNWEIKYKNNSSYITTYSNEATGIIEYNTISKDFLIGFTDMSSLKFFLTLYGSADPANKSRAITNLIFAILNPYIVDGIIKVEDKNLWNTYGGWWRGKYIISFDRIKIYNNTGKNIKIIIAYLYGNELWFKSGNTEAEKNWLLPLAKRWSPFDNVDSVGRVREDGDTYIQFTLNILNADEIVYTAQAVNDNAESSKVFVDGNIIVSQVNNGNNLKQGNLANGKHTIKLFGHKTWSHISPRICILMFNGEVNVESSEISPDKYGDPTPMIITFDPGETIIENMGN